MYQNCLRIAFMGTPDFARAALEALCKTQHEITCVYTQPPRPKGRGQHVQKSSVHQYAEAQNIPVFYPPSLKSDAAQQEFAAHKIDVAVVAAYGLLLPQAVLEAPKYGCLNIHASLLPRWRGASPIQRAIWAGDQETGISIMQMDSGLDTGPVILKRAIPITEHSTASSMHDALAALGTDMIVEVLDLLAENKNLNPEIQDNSMSTYAPLLSKKDSKIDWTLTAGAIDRQIRALNPWPGTYATLDGQRVKILEAVISPSPLIPLPEGRGKASASEQGEGDSKTGQILNRHGDIACGHNTILSLVKIQPANAKAMDFAAAVNGGYIDAGIILS